MRKSTRGMKRDGSRRYGKKKEPANRKEAGKMILMEKCLTRANEE